VPFLHSLLSSFLTGAADRHAALPPLRFVLAFLPPPPARYRTSRDDAILSLTPLL
jgi:hypothetical protein